MGEQDSMINLWIWRQKQKRKGVTLISIISLSVVLALVHLGIEILWQVMRVYQSEWYEQEVVYMMTGDRFFAEKMKMITMVLSAIFGGVAVYMLSVAWVFRKMQLQEYGWKAASYLLCGYPQRKVRQALHLDSFADVCMAIPVSIIWYTVGIGIMEKVYSYINIMKISGLDSSVYTDVMENVISIALVMAVVILQEEIWLKKEEKQGLVHMLKCG